LSILSLCSSFISLYLATRLLESSNETHTMKIIIVRTYLFLNIAGIFSAKLNLIIMIQIYAFFLTADHNIYNLYIITIMQKNSTLDSLEKLISQLSLNIIILILNENFFRIYLGDRRFFVACCGELQFLRKIGMDLSEIIEVLKYHRKLR
jgi:hypothetical protein